MYYNSLMKRIYLSGKYSYLFAFVDDEDYQDLVQYKWHFNRGYACRGRADSRVFMQWHIMRTKKLFDHSDRNKLNNQKYNLKLSTPSMNQRNTKLSANNTSGYNGIYWRKQDHKWLAQITIMGAHKSLGLFNDIRDAIKAREVFVKKIMANYGKYDPGITSTVSGP